MKGKKLGQKRIFTESGVQIAVTEIELLDDKPARLHLPSARADGGQEENLVVGDKLKITGQTKGQGFLGVVGRWHFRGGPKTHGQSDRQRAPGSIGQTTTPGRVYKGKKMSGRGGGKTVTVKGLKVVEINLEKKLLVVSGLVPGSKGKMLKITKDVIARSE